MIIGEISAIAGSCFWASCSVFFTFSVYHLGIYALNLVRLFFALCFLGLTLWLWKGTLIPIEATAEDWFWLALSSVVGLVIGDLFYFGALHSIGPRITLLLFTLAPPVAALGEWLVYGQGLGVLALAGMGITLSGVAMVITDRKSTSAKSPFSLTLKGLVLGAMAAVCQGGGLVLSKMGLENLDALSGTFIRMCVASPLFALVYFAMGGKIQPIYHQRKGTAYALCGAFFGPFLGVTMSLVAVKYTHAGIAMTILSTTPITILPYAVLVYKERLSPKAILGAFVSVIGIAMLCL